MGRTFVYISPGATGGRMKTIAMPQFAETMLPALHQESIYHIWPAGCTCLDNFFTYLGAVTSSEPINIVDIGGIVL